MKRYIAEYVGTFSLVFCGTGAIIIDRVTNGAVTHTGVSLVFGLIVTAMIYAFSHISGAHINPAVSLVMYLRKKLLLTELFGYMSAQFTGALSASILLHFLFPQSTTLGETIPHGSDLQSFIIEFILTFTLLISILQVSSHEETKRFTAITAGSVVGLEALFAGPISGASMNPFRSLAPGLISGNLQSIWIYLAAPVLGALFALMIFSYFQKNEKHIDPLHG